MERRPVGVPPGVSGRRTTLTGQREQVPPWPPWGCDGAGGSGRSRGWFGAVLSRTEPCGTSDVLASEATPRVRLVSWLAHRRLVVALTASAGFVAGHAAAYVVVYPRGSARAATMHATGHGYWGAATAIAVAAGLAALATTGWRAARATGVDVRLAPLAAGQIALFAAAEAAERLAAGVSLTHLVEAPEFLAGLAAQVIVASIAVWFLRRWGRLVEAVVRRRRHTVDSGRAPRAVDPLSLVPRVLPGSVRTRAPPLLAAA